jgi:hypothetical protein
LEHQVGKGGGEVTGIFQLGDISTGEVHGFTGVYDEIRSEVGLFLILFDVKAVGLAVKLPVHTADFIARTVCPMLSKFYTETVIRTLVQTYKISLYHQPRTEKHIV